MPESDDLEKKIGHWIVVGCCALVVAVVTVWSVLDPWLASRLKTDFWPVDRSFVAPNLTAAAVQAVIVLVVVSLCYPPWRKAFARFFGRHFSAVDAKLEAHHAEVLAQAKAHHEAILAQNEEHHEEALALARSHHAEHMAALARRRPAAKKAVRKTAKKQPAKGRTR